MFSISLFVGSDTRFVVQYIHMMRTADVSTTDLTQATEQLWKILAPAISYLSESDQEIIELAFYQMAEAHGEQRRKSGEFYIIHPVEACLTLADIKLDRDTLAATLMHDVPEDTEVSLRKLSKTFNREIIFLISGITKLSVIKYKGEDRYAENLRRMFVAMSKDLRVVFIKLADRLHNLRTLKNLPAEKAKRIALESLEIYAPIAERLGMGMFKDEIENICFPYVYPDEYKQLISLSTVEYQKREKQAGQIIKKTTKILDEEGIPYIALYGRAKKYYSLFKKMREKKSLDKIYDLVALRVITESVEDCYNVLAALHNYFIPVEGRVKDYIDQPKENGYQSIHSTLIDPTSKIVFEFQIRTEAMHEYAEYGVAAHWSHKQKAKFEEFTFLNPDRLKWIKELVDLGKEKLSEEEYLKYVKLDLFQDQIFVMTPKGDAISLPQGGTPLDFAYRIHQDIGRHATMAKVNGQPVKLSYELSNGDEVEIITDKKQKPNRDWLKIVKSVSTARAIRHDLRKQGIKV